MEGAVADLRLAHSPYPGQRHRGQHEPRLWSGQRSSHYPTTWNEDSPAGWQQQLHREYRH